MQKRDGHFAGLDALRGLGAALVMGVHVYALDPDMWLFQRGYLAVDLFFVLSGFVIAHAYEDRLLSGSLELPRYLLVRLVRLYPLLILGVVLGVAENRHVGATPHVLVVHGIAQALLVPSLWVAGNLFLLNGCEWSLFFELLVNAAHARAIAILRDDHVLIAAVGIAAAAFLLAIVHYGTADIGMSRENFAGGFPRVAFGFLSGVLICRHAKRGAAPVRSAGLAFVLLALPVAMIAAVVSRIDPRISDCVIAMILCPFCVWLAARHAPGPTARRLGLGAGLLSYPVYAIHVPLLQAANVGIAQAHLARADRIAAWLFVAVTIVALAYGFERVWDRPIRAILLARLDRRRPDRTLSMAARS